MSQVAKANGNTVLKPQATARLLATLSAANAGVTAQFSGALTARQPVHTVYGGAQLFRADTALKLGELARTAMQTYAPDAHSFAKALAIKSQDPTQTPELAAKVYARVQEKLQREPVEDLRIDFEDGFGVRSADEEDATAASSALEVARGLERGTLPQSIGIRVKSLCEESKERALRTLDLFLAHLLAASGGVLPPLFFVTLPKVTTPEQVEVMASVLTLLEQGHQLDSGALRLEIMIETTQSLVDAEGRLAMPRLTGAAKGRLAAAHFGAYDYTAALGITAAQQTLDHQCCDFARQLLQLASAGLPLFLADGATTVMPVGPHRPGPRGQPLTTAEAQENTAAVHGAWRHSYEQVLHSLSQGYYQGWDLHPAQIPVRYAANYAFFLDGFLPTAVRLKTFIARAAQAQRLGVMFDDAATGLGLLNYFRRGVNSGAFTATEVTAAGLPLTVLEARSFTQLIGK